MPGRLPESNVSRLARGKDPRILPDDQPRYEVLDTVRPPSYIKGIALTEWKRMSKILTDAKMMLAPTVMQLARYCVAYQDYVEVLQTRESLDPDEKHSVVRWQQQIHWMKVMQFSEKVMREFEESYGLNPSSVTGVRRPDAGNSPGNRLAAFSKQKKVLPAGDPLA